MTKLDEKLKEEYINYYCIYRNFTNLDFITNYKNKKLTYKLLQFFIEDRILYRYKIKKPPYNGYNPFESDEYEMAKDFIKEHKKYMEENNSKNEIYYNLEKIMELFIDTVNNKKVIFKEFYEDNNNKINKFNDYITYKKVKINLDNRLNFLLNKMGSKRFVRLILRYCGYGLTAQHCSLPFNVYQHLYNEFSIRGEGFSSPLNSKLIGFKDTVFCTLFKDTDKYVGSKGIFSYKTIVKNSEHNWTVNPPYMGNVMYMAYKNVVKAFKCIERKDFLVIVLIPRWTDDKTYIKLSKSKYLARLVEPDEGTHYMNCNGVTNYMKGVVNSMFFLCRDKNYVTDEKVDKLLKLWNTYYEDTTNQSSFIDCEII